MDASDAAATSLARASRYLVASDPFPHPLSRRPVRVLYSTLTNERLVVSDEIYMKLSEGLVDLLPPALVQCMSDTGMVVPPGTDERANLLSQNTKLDEARDEYLLTIMPTANCQMACSYCGQSHKKEQMEPSIAESTIRLARRQVAAGKYAMVNVTWFGGEPLIGVDTMRTMTPQLRSIAHEHGARYQASVITNGLSLTPRLARELEQEMSVVRVQVTLDGLAHSHDMRRFKKNGAGSFQRIAANLANIASERDVLRRKIHIRCNVDSDNAHDVIPLIRYLVREGIAPLIDRFYMAGVIDWDNGADKNALSLQAFAALQVQVMEELVAQGLPLDPLPSRTTGMCKVYYQSDAPLVTNTGHLHNCYEYPLVQFKSRDVLARVGHVDKDQTVSASVTPTDVMLSMRDDGHQCLSCEMLPICGGVCEPHWKKGIRRCPGFKVNLKDWLRIDYLHTQTEVLDGRS